MKYIPFILMALALLAACAVPPVSEKSIYYVPPVAENATVQENTSAVVDVVTTAPDIEIDLAAMEHAIRGFADGYDHYDAAEMYPYLHNALRQRVTVEQLASILFYFKPKDRMHMRFKEINGVDGSYDGLVEVGSDSIGWRDELLPLLNENGEWHVFWFDDVTTRDGLIAGCNKRAAPGEEDTAQVAGAKALSLSSCMENGALALNDQTICPYAIYDRQRCFKNLGIELTKAMKVDICANEEGVIDNVTIAKCLWTLAVEEQDADICRKIETNRVERYFCLGDVGGALGQPFLCNEAMNDYTTKLCLQHYIDTTHNAILVCSNPNWARLMNC